MIAIEEDKSGLVLTYSPEDQGSEWVGQALRDSQTVRFERIFKLKRDDLIAEPTEAQDDGGFEYKFRFGKRDGNYHRIPGRILQIKNDILIAAGGIQVNRRLFVAVRNISIFRRMAEVIGGEAEIVVAGDRPGNIPVAVFEELLRKFPNSTELERHANARVSNLIGEYFDGMKDFRAQYEAYLSRRKSADINRTKFKPKELLETEINKFVLIRDTIARLCSMTPHYATVYQISAQQSSSLMADVVKFVPTIFGIAALLLGVVIVAGKVRSGWRQPHWFIPIFLGVFGVLSLRVLAPRSLHQEPDALQAYQKGDYHTVEGLVTNFDPMPYEGHRPECFSVQDKRFCYSDYVISPGFRNTASHGGPIRPGLRVRIAYRDAGQHTSILRLDIAEDQTALIN